MKYALLIYGDEKEGFNTSKEQIQVRQGKYQAYVEAMDKAGVRLAGNRLHPTSAATTVRMQNGKRMTTHGPFAETKEQLGGFVILDVNNLDEALEWAGQFAGATDRSIEVRPVMDLPRPVSG